MELTGEYRIEAPREAVWRGLNDPEILKQSIAGCEELTKDSDTSFAARVKAKIGPVSATFGGKVTLSDLDPPNGYKISGEGQGGVAGFAKGSAEVKLVPDGAATILHYTVNATVGGKLAQIGSRLVDATARKMSEDFFTRFAGVVEAGIASAAAAPASAAPATAQVPARKGLPPVVWIGGLIAIVVILLLVFAR
jgi:uncharacterized protein